MIYTPKNSQKLALVDAFDNPIHNAFHFDTDTGRVGFYPLTYDGRHIVENAGSGNKRMAQAWMTLFAFGMLIRVRNCMLLTNS